MPGIFISYRRDDAAGHTGALARELNQRFGTEHVFLDLDDIRGGEDFVAALEDALGRCDVLIAVIGPRWLTSADAQGRRRLDAPGDFVRKELAEALRRKVTVVPLLVEDGRMPSDVDLPEDLRPISTRNALRLRNASWQYDVDLLADAVRSAFYGPTTGSTTVPVPVDFTPGRWMDPRRQLLAGLFGAIGLVFTIIAVLSFLETRRFVARAAEASGTVVDNVLVGDTYRAVVSFETSPGDAITIRSSAGSNPPAHDVGDTVRVLYDPAAPADGRLASFSSLWGLAVLFSGFGAGGLAISAGVVGAAVVRRRRRIRLLRTGRPIMTVFDRVEQNTSFRFNGRHPYCVVTKWRNPISGETVSFRSDDMWDDPTERIRHRSITVLVDPARLSHYVMDLSIVERKQEPA